MWYDWHMTYNRWTNPDNEARLVEAVKRATSTAGVCRELGIVDGGGNIATIKYHIARLDLDISHHKGQAWNKGDFSTPRNGSSNKKWREFLIRERGHKCWDCGLSEWTGKPIPLELDHIDGNNSNNDESNLRVLCCNCHALTPTFRNMKRK